jgi:hypothetical protein
MRHFIALGVLIFIVSCLNKKAKERPVTQNDSITASIKFEETSSLIKKHNKLRDGLLSDTHLPSIVKSYIQDTNVVVILDQITDPIRYKSLGDINGDDKKDSIFLMPEFVVADSVKHLGNICESFTFTDKSLSRIQEDEGCNSLDDIFVVGDIDQDGIEEIGLYTSSCASHYKALRVYSYKKNQWKEAGAVTFDLFYKKPSKKKELECLAKENLQ